MTESLEARDPDTKPERLRELFFQYSNDVLENPALPLVLLENPGWLHTLDHDSLGRLLLNPELPEYFVQSLTNHPMSNVARVASMHVALGEEIVSWEPLLKNLAALGYTAGMQRALEGHGLIPIWLRSYLPEVTISKEMKFYEAPAWQVAEALMEKLDKQPGYFAWFCCLLVTRKEARLARAARSVSWFTRMGAALHESSKLGALKYLRGDSNRYIRFAARARLRDTTWVFPPAACGGQGEKS